jgi:hypothetical protein
LALTTHRASRAPLYRRSTLREIDTRATSLAIEVGVKLAGERRMFESRIRRLIARLRDLLNLPATVQGIARQSHEELRSLKVALKSQAHRIDSIRARQSKQNGHIERELRGLHDEVRDRLLQ